MTKVTVMSYNLHSGIGMDGKVDYERIGSVIRESGADLAGLQEIAIDHPFSHVHDPLAVLEELLLRYP